MHSNVSTYSADLCRIRKERKKERDHLKERVNRGTMPPVISSSDDSSSEEEESEDQEPESTTVYPLPDLPVADVFLTSSSSPSPIPSPIDSTDEPQEISESEEEEEEEPTAVVSVTVEPPAAAAAADAVPGRGARRPVVSPSENRTFDSRYRHHIGGKEHNLSWAYRLSPGIQMVCHGDIIQERKVNKEGATTQTSYHKVVSSTIMAAHMVKTIKNGNNKTCVDWDTIASWQSMVTTEELVSFEDHTTLKGIDTRQTWVVCTDMYPWPIIIVGAEKMRKAIMSSASPKEIMALNTKARSLKNFETVSIGNKICAILPMVLYKNLIKKSPTPRAGQNKRSASTAATAAASANPMVNHFSKRMEIFITEVLDDLCRNGEGRASASARLRAWRSDCLSKYEKMDDSMGDDEFLVSLESDMDRRVRQRREDVDDESMGQMVLHYQLAVFILMHPLGIKRINDLEEKYKAEETAMAAANL